MSEYLIKDCRNFYNLTWLDEYMMGHKGFIAGGCFKNIFNEEKVKDIDLFFENEDDFEEAKRYYNDNDNFKFVYQNNKAISYKHNDSGIRIELIESIFGKPEDILNQFDFTITKFAYYKDVEIDFDSDEDEEITVYKILHHKDFFEHLTMKRLVSNKDLKFPISTFERMIRYIRYGYLPCRETKLNIIKAIKENNNVNDSLSETMYEEGFD